MTIGGEGNQDEVIDLLNECLKIEEKANDLLHIVCIVACRDVISRHPRIIAEHPEIVNQLVQIAWKALQLILAPNSGFSELYTCLSVLLAGTDFKTAMAKNKKAQE